MITGPNTGGKTVALKTAGLLPLMAQSGLLIPAAEGPRCRSSASVFADIGDEQSIAESLSTFSAHIANIVATDKALALPALVLLDEAGGGTDPNEGGALATAIIDHFRRRGAMVVATTHFDALKTYASTTEGVTSAGFGFNPETFAPTYRLHYGSPGSSLALEIATRLGLPARHHRAGARAADARARRSWRSTWPRSSARCRGSITSAGWWRASGRWSKRRRRSSKAASSELRDREETFRKRLDQKLDERLRDARREIDAVVDALKTRDVVDRGRRRAPRGAAGADRRHRVGASRRAERAGGDCSEGRATVEAVRRLRAGALGESRRPLGDKVAVGPLGLEGIVQSIHDGHAEVDVRGKRMRARVDDLRVLAGAPAAPAKAQVHVNVTMAPREAAVRDQRDRRRTRRKRSAGSSGSWTKPSVNELRSLRIIHGYGTGALRRSIAEFLRAHPCRFTRPGNQGGAGTSSSSDRRLLPIGRMDRIGDWRRSSSSRRP